MSGHLGEPVQSRRQIIHQQTTTNHNSNPPNKETNKQVTITQFHTAVTTTPTEHYGLLQLHYGSWHGANTAPPGPRGSANSTRCHPRSAGTAVVHHWRRGFRWPPTGPGLSCGCTGSGRTLPASQTPFSCHFADWYFLQAT
jgi:hypothetical protein